VVLAFLATGALVTNEPKVTQVMSKDLTDIPGKEGLMLLGRDVEIVIRKPRSGRTGRIQVTAA